LTSSATSSIGVRLSGVKSRDLASSAPFVACGPVPAGTRPPTYHSERHPFGERPTVPIDSQLLFVVVTLVMLGLIVVYATTYHRGMACLLSQAVRAVLGFAALLVGTQLRHTVFNGRLRQLMLGGALALLVLTLVIGVAFGSAKRWLGDGSVSFQPAELAKLALLIWLAGWLGRLKENGQERSFKHSLVIPGLVTGAVVGLTLAQPAIGSSFIMAASALAVFFAAGVRLRYIVLTLVLAAGVFVLAVKFTDYPRRRWERFVHGERYHQEQSLIAIGSGGPFGKGLGEGRQKFQFLPKMHNDFIFAEVGEEFGFAGSLVIYVLYGLLFLRGMRVSRECSGQFGQNLAAGITTMLFLYALVHVAVTLGVIPTTGQPLPFVSFGGSALITNLFAAGILLNISRYRRSSALPIEQPWKRRPTPGFTAAASLHPKQRVQLVQRAGFVGNRGSRP
jgi:cell division protein FtsW